MQQPQKFTIATVFSLCPEPSICYYLVRWTNKLARLSFLLLVRPDASNRLSLLSFETAAPFHTSQFLRR